MFDSATATLCVELEVLNDLVLEQVEVLQLQLSSDEPAVRIPVPSLSVTIVDNDSKMSVYIRV